MFKVKADKKVLVVQYMTGYGGDFNQADPAMVQAVNVEQFRSNYLFHSDVDWVGNVADIVAPAGASVMLDGSPVSDFAPIGDTGFGAAHVALSNAGDGNHRLTADAPVGLSVYGVQDYGSYWYPGGLDLEPIVVE